MQSRLQGDGWQFSVACTKVYAECNFTSWAHKVSQEQNQCHAIMRTPLNRALAVRFVHCAPVVCTTVVHINRTSLDNRKASSIWKGQLWLLRHGNGSQNCTRPAKQAHYDLKHFSGIAKLVWRAVLTRQNTNHGLCVRANRYSGWMGYRMTNAFQLPI